MNNTDKELSEEFLDRLFSNTYHELSDKELANNSVSRDEVAAIHNSMALIGLSKSELKLDTDLKHRLMRQYDKLDLKKSHKVSTFWLKAAAIVLLIISNVVLINYYLGNGPAITPNVSGADTGIHSRQKDTVRVKTDDSIQASDKDTVMAALPVAQDLISECEKYFLNSFILFQRVKNREFQAALYIRTNYFI